MSAEQPQVSGVLVACVDDDYRVRESVENLLDSAGLACESFESAEAFLESGVLDGVSCLLVDVRMGGLSGLELQRAVRVLRPKLPVIFISAYQDAAVRALALADGATAFFGQAVRRAHASERAP